jgi:hypothetical protein
MMDVVPIVRRILKGERPQLPASDRDEFLTRLANEHQAQRPFWDARACTGFARHVARYVAWT